jgi:hypothetical protein
MPGRIAGPAVTEGGDPIECRSVASMWDVIAPLGGIGALLACLAAQSGAQNRPRFADAALRADFPYRTNNGFTGRKYFPQPMCGGVAIFDFDNDGLPDIFFTNGAKFPELRKVDSSFHNCLLRN